MSVVDPVRHHALNFIKDSRILSDKTFIKLTYQYQFNEK